MTQSTRGFTLIELMVTVAIVAILASVAYPSYRKQVMRSNRAEGRNALLQVQVAQEKFFLQRNRYAGETPYTNPTAIAELNNAPTNTTTPGLGIPSLTVNRLYEIRLDRPTTTTYTVTAIAQGGQTNDTGCTTLSIDQSGTRSPTTGNCWK